MFSVNNDKAKYYSRGIYNYRSSSNTCLSITKGHGLKLLAQRFPILCTQLGILDTLLRPLLVHSADVVLGSLEVYNLVANTFLDEDATSVLVDYRLLVLRLVSKEIICISW